MHMIIMKLMLSFAMDDLNQWTHICIAQLFSILIIMLEMARHADFFNLPS